MVFLKNRVGKLGTAPLAIAVKFDPSSEPARVKEVGSRSAASLAEVRVSPLTTVEPAPGVTVKPVGMALFAPSKLRYLFAALSIALATPSEPGLLLELGTMGSPGTVTSLGASTPSNSTSEICMQHVLPLTVGKRSL